MNRDDPLGATFEVLKEVCAEIGADTGYLFYHPYRGLDGDDRGFWKNVLPDGTEKGMSELKEEISHSPHFHAVVCAKWIDGQFITKHIEEKTGWVIHRITKNDEPTVSLRDDYDLARSVSYCLSHTGIGKNRVAYRAFGEVANFTATDKISREMDARVRSVVPNTLGLKLSSVACRVERLVTVTKEIQVPAEKVNVEAAMAAGYSEPQMETVEIEETEMGECNGRMIEVGAFPRYLNNREWTAKAPHAQDMARRHREWKSYVANRKAGVEDFDKPPG